jgi:CMP-2-keto-3-deoxyoctulosonic acid synthetase
MLRILEHGYKVCGVVTDKVSIGVDIPSHIAKVESIIRKDAAQRKIFAEIKDLCSIKRS